MIVLTIMMIQLADKFVCQSLCKLGDAKRSHFVSVGVGAPHYL